MEHDPFFWKGSGETQEPCTLLGKLRATLRASLLRRPNTPEHLSRQTKFFSVFGKTVFGVSVFLAVYLALLNVVVDDTQPSHQSAIRQFSDVVRDANVILRTAANATAASTVEINRQEALNEGSQLVPSPECFPNRRHRTPCDLIVIVNDGHKYRVFGDHYFNRTETWAAALAEYADILVELADAKDLDEVEQLCSSINKALWKVNMATPACSLEEFGKQQWWQSRARIKQDMMIAQVKRAEAALDIVTDNLKFSLTTAMAVQLKAKYASLSRDQTEFPKHDERERRVIYDRMTSDVLHLRIILAADPTDTIDRVRRAHMAIYQSLTGPEAQRRNALVELIEIGKLVASTKRAVDALRGG